MAETCRICRCEASLDDPLFNPCKCRGSIKYVHQNCLVEWLNHSHRSPKCDICNVEYKFTTVYQDNTPEKMPVSLVIKKALSMCKGVVLTVLMIFNGVVFDLIQLPLVLVLSFRVCTWLIDGSMPYPDSVALSLLFGSNFKDPRLGTELQSLSFKNVLTAIRFAVAQGAFVLIPLVLVHIILFFTRELVESDEGFEKLIKKNFGDQKEYHKYILSQLESLTVNPDGEADPRRTQMFEEVVEMTLDDYRNRRPAVDNPENAVDVDNRENNQENIGFQMEIGLNYLAPIKLACIAGPILACWPIAFYFIPCFLGRVIISTGVVLGKILFHRANDYLKEFAVSWAAKYPGAHSSVLSFSSKYVSYGSSRLVTMFYDTVNVFVQLIGIPFVETVQNIASKEPLSVFGRALCMCLSFYLILMFFYYRLKSYEAKYKAGPGLIKKPLLGSARLYCIFLCNIFSTLKVFTIFSLELVIFPIYCGFLVDLVIAPVLLDQFKLAFKNPFAEAAGFPSVSNNVVQIFGLNQFNSVSNLFAEFAVNFSPESWALASLPFSAKTLLYWAFGTTYMCLLSFFVGMTRSEILRSGVLYFIRSPDDQNARLFHEAVVKPFGLQLSRIALSGVIYTVFVVFGIGAVTYSMRFWFQTELLPVKTCFRMSSFLYINPVVWKFVVESPIIAKYIRLYWKRVFAKTCRLLRLSSFLLGVDYPDERGYICKRHFWNLFANPDYTEPQSRSSIKQYFLENPDKNAAFIPDGNYVRAPDSETIKRKFLYKMFVPVTKDDKFLTEINEPEEINVNDSDADDEEPTHTVVYRPPEFRWRLAAFLSLIWIFSVILILSILLLAFYIGRPITKIICVTEGPNWLQLLTFGATEGYCATGSQADLTSIVFGIWAMLFGLHFVDNWNSNRVIDIGFSNIDFANLAVNWLKFAWDCNLALLQIFLFTILNVVWIMYTHFICVDLTWSYFHNTTDFRAKLTHPTDFSEETLTLDLSNSLILIHLALSFFTILPLLINFWKGASSIMRNGLLATLVPGPMFRAMKSMISNFVRFYLPSAIIVIFIDVVLETQFPALNSLGEPIKGAHKEHLPLYMIPDDGYLLSSIPMQLQHLLGDYEVHFTKTSAHFVLQALALFSGCSAQLFTFLRGYFAMMNEIVKEEVYAKSQRLENLGEARVE